MVREATFFFAGLLSYLWVIPGLPFRKSLPPLTAKGMLCAGLAVVALLWLIGSALSALKPAVAALGQVPGIVWLYVFLGLGATLIRKRGSAYWR